VGEVRSDAVEVESLTVDFTFDSDDFRIEATTPTATPQGTAELPGATAISYFDLDAIGIEADTMDHAQLTVQVSEDALPAGTSNDDVVIFHFTDNEWETLDTEYLGEGRFAANTTSFSALAVGVPSSTSTPSTSQPTESSAEETESPATSTQSADTETAAEKRTETTSKLPHPTSLTAYAVRSLRVGL